MALLADLSRTPHPEWRTPVTVPDPALTEPQSGVTPLVCASAVAGAGSPRSRAGAPALPSLSGPAVWPCPPQAAEPPLVESGCFAGQRSAASTGIPRKQALACGYGVPARRKAGLSPGEHRSRELALLGVAPLLSGSKNSRSHRTQRRVLQRQQESIRSASRRMREKKCSSRS